MRLSYPCRIKLKDEVYLITFRDFKGLGSEALSYEEALETAEEMLNTQLELMIQEEEVINPPSPPKNDDVLIPVRCEIAAKINYIS